MPLPALSAAERFALAGAALLVLLHALASTGLAGVDAAWLEYRPEAVRGEPWRLLTAHFVHINWPHALINAAAWWIVARLYAPELTPRHQLAVLAAASVVIGAGLALLHPTIAWYRGFSGVLHALFFAGGVQWLVGVLRGAPDLRTLWLPLLLVAGGAAKVVLEQPAGSNTPHADWLGAGTVPQAHLLGALVGAAFGLVWGGSEQRVSQRRERA